MVTVMMASVASELHQRKESKSVSNVVMCDEAKIEVAR